MRIDEAIKAGGQFWVPEDENHKFQGTLNISDGGEVILELTHEHSGLDSPFQDVNRIGGRVDGFGYVTLENCWVMRSGFNNSGLGNTEVWVDAAICSIALEADEDLLISSATFSLEGLDEWMRGRAIHPKMVGVGSLNVEFKVKEPIKFELQNGWGVEIFFPYTYETKGRGFSVKQNSYIKVISPTPVAIDSYKSMLHNVARFFSFANGTICCIKDVVFRSKETVRTDSKGESNEIPMPYFYRSLPFLRFDEVTPDPLFYFSDIADFLPDLFNNWNSICTKYKPAMWLYISCLSNRYINHDAKFLAIMQATENMLEFEPGEFGIEESEYEELVSGLISECPDEHIEWLGKVLKYANKPSLRRKLKNLLSPFHEIFGNKKQRLELVALAKDTRDYLTHYDQRLSDYIAKGSALYKLKFQIEKAFEFKLMLLIGMNPKKIVSIVKRNNRILERLRPSN